MINWSLSRFWLKIFMLVLKKKIIILNIRKVSKKFPGGSDTLDDTALSRFNG
jgi:hypothetical protein